MNRGEVQDRMDKAFSLVSSFSNLMQSHTIIKDENMTKNTGANSSVTVINLLLEKGE